MAIVPIHKAKAELSRLIQRSCAGETIIIARRDQPLVKLVPIESPARKFGAMRGQATVTEEFFEPLSDDELDAWEQ